MIPYAVRPGYFATLVGGRRARELNYTLDPDPYTWRTRCNPIMKGHAGHHDSREAFFRLTGPDWHDSRAANNEIPGTPALADHKGEVSADLTYAAQCGRRKKARAFVWMQGHTYAISPMSRFGHVLRGLLGPVTADR